jgi:hypothetical protein
MRKIKSATKKEKIQKNTFLDSKAKIINAVIAVVVVMIIVAVFMFMESGKGNLVIKNDTDLKLEYVKVTFVNSEGPMNEGMNFENIDANNSKKILSGQHDLRGTEANLEVRFKFENYDEIFTDAGYFNDDFKGNIYIDFERTKQDGVVTLKVKAKNSLLPSNLINCDEEYSVDLSKGYVAE